MASALNVDLNLADDDETVEISSINSSNKNQGVRSR